MDVTFRFYDASQMNVFREDYHPSMKDVTIMSVKAALNGVFDAFDFSLPFLVARQFVANDEFIFNVIIDGSCLADCFCPSVLDDIAYMVDRILLCHHG